MEQLGIMLRIAWRNLFRNQRRTLLTLSNLVIGCTGLILIGGYFDNVMVGMREQLIHSQYGHLQVNAAGYDRKGVADPFAYLMTDPVRVKELAEMSPHVLYTVPRLRISGMASSESTSVAVVALGTDHFSESRMGNMTANNVTIPAIHLIAGNDLDESDPYGALVGKGLMKALGLKLGGTVNFLTTRQAGALDGAPFHIRGVFETIFKDADDHTMKVNLNVLQKLAGVGANLHTLLVVLDDTNHVEEAKADISQRLRASGQRLETLSWSEVDRVYGQYEALRRKITAIIDIIIFVVYFFSVANTVNMSLMERMREFGTMMAIGNGREEIFGIIFIEVLLFAVVGSLIGVAVGSGAAMIVSAIGIQMPPPPLGTNPYTAIIAVNGPLLIRSFDISLLSTLIAGLVPAYRGSHFKIVDALAYV